MEKIDTSFTAYSNNPVEQWTIEEVATYARKVLDFDSDDTAALEKAKLTGRRLLHIESKKELIDAGLSLGPASDLWAEIENLLNKPLAEPGTKTLPKKRRRDGGDKVYESYEDYDVEPAKKRFKVDSRQQSDPVPFTLNLSRNAQKRKVMVALQTLFVGRTSELEQLKSRVEQNLIGLHLRPTTIIISGPCGIGKSHLALKLIQEVKFDWSIAITAIEGSTPNQLLWEELGLPGPPKSNYEIFQLILESLGSKQKPLNLVIYFDEIHHFESSLLQAFRQDMISFSTNNHTKALFQLILTGVSTTFLPLDLGKSAKQPCTGGWYVANLQPFNHHDSGTLLRSVLKVGDDPAHWKIKEAVIESAVGWFGGNPRLIEFAATCLKQNPKHSTQSLINSVTQYFSSMYSQRLAKKHTAYPIIIAACLSQQLVCYSDKLRSKDDTIVKVLNLVRKGVVGFKPSTNVEVYRKDTLGCLTLSLLEVRLFVSLNNLNFNVPLLMDPKRQWTWSKFEHFVAEMLSIKLQAFSSLGKQTVTVADMFPGISMSDKIAKQKISTSFTPDVLILAHRCKDYSAVKKAYESGGMQMMPQTAVFINTPNAQSWDVAYVGPKDLELVVQVKHTVKEDGGDNITASIIKEELAKIPAEKPSLFITKHKAKDLKLVRTTYQNLILVTCENLATFLGMFSLHRFID